MRPHHVASAIVVGQTARSRDRDIGPPHVVEIHLLEVVLIYSLHAVKQGELVVKLFLLRGCNVFRLLDFPVGNRRLEIINHSTGGRVV